MNPRRRTGRYGAP